MKRTLSMLTLAVLTVGLLGSCAKINERLDGLDKRIDGLENERIASIESQIGSITSSIADLGTIRSNIQSLTTTAESQGKDITDLQAADKALDKRIEDLKKYVDDTLKSYATAQWVEATFVTLEQYKATCDTVAMIDAKLGETSEQLSKDIQACADSLTEWVNTQFKGYYTAAQMDAEIAKLKAAIDTASGVSEKTTDSLKTELKKAEVAIDTAKAQITRQYTSAIATAITTSEGRLTKTLQDTIATVNGRIDALAKKVTNLKNAVSDLASKVTALENMIQSVTIVPAFSDGSVKIDEFDTLYIDCIITPAEAVKYLDTADFTILLKEVQTKAVALDTVPTDSIKFFKIYKENGTVSIKAHIKKTLAELGEESLTVALNVKKDKSDYTTEFVPAYIVSYVEIGGIKWATKNLGATSVAGSPETAYGDYYEWGKTRKLYSAVTYTSAMAGSFIFKDEFAENGYSWETYCGQPSFTELNPKPYDETTKILKPEYDIVTKTLGEDWRMPSKADFESLCAACGRTDENMENIPDITTATVSGNKVTSKGVYWCADNQEILTNIRVPGILFSDGINNLFLPASGRGYYYNSADLDYVGNNCFYWSSTLYNNNTWLEGCAFFLSFYLSDFSIEPADADVRCNGFPIRPVKAGTNATIVTESHSEMGVE